MVFTASKLSLLIKHMLGSSDHVVSKGWLSSFSGFTFHKYNTNLVKPENEVPTLESEALLAPYGLFLNSSYESSHKRLVT